MFPSIYNHQVSWSIRSNQLLHSHRNQYLQLKMKLKQLLLFVLMVSSRWINRRDTSNAFRDSMIALGTMEHGHAILDEAFFYDFMSLSIEFNREHLDEFVRVNIDPTFAGFTDKEFDSLLENWIFGMLSVSYWSIIFNAKPLRNFKLNL